MVSWIFFSHCMCIIILLHYLTKCTQIQHSFQLQSFLPPFSAGTMIQACCSQQEAFFLLSLLSDCSSTSREQDRYVSDAQWTAQQPAGQWQTHSTSTYDCKTATFDSIWERMNEWMLFWATILHCKVRPGQGQSELMRWIFYINHAPGVALISRLLDLQSSVPQFLRSLKVIDIIHLWSEHISVNPRTNATLWSFISKNSEETHCLWFIFHLVKPSFRMNKFVASVCPFSTKISCLSFHSSSTISQAAETYWANGTSVIVASCPCHCTRQ